MAAQRSRRGRWSATAQFVLSLLSMVVYGDVYRTKLLLTRARWKYITASHTGSSYNKRTWQSSDLYRENRGPRSPLRSQAASEKVQMPLRMVKTRRRDEDWNTHVKRSLSTPSPVPLDILSFTWIPLLPLLRSYTWMINHVGSFTPATDSRRISPSHKQCLS